MNENRVNYFKEQLRGKGPVKGVPYTNQAIVDLLQELLGGMKGGIYERTHAEYMRDKDVMMHISALAKEYGLDATDTFRRFEANMNDLGYTIGSFIKGMKGEKIARRALN